MQAYQPIERRPPLARRVLLIGWDGADWKMINPLIEAGQMPNLARFTEHGVMGNVASLTPMLSPILWTSIATGKHADKHQILGFAEPDGASGGIRPVTSTSRKCKAIWNILSDQGLRAGAINWFASHPAEKIDGFVITDRFVQAVGGPNKPWPVPAGAIYPLDLVDLASRQRIHPAMTTPGQVARFIPRLRELDPATDKNLQQLRVMLAQCATLQRVATCLMQTREWDFLGVYFDAIDRFAHVFMEYHPPKMEHVSARDFELYSDVMNACYRFHDQMLGRVMQLAGDDTLIILLSDHGFYSDHLRPAGTSKIQDGRPVAWHRPYGIIAALGPGARKDERLYGATLLDVAPTILYALGLPVARDMDGQVLSQMFEDAVQIERRPDWIQTYETLGPPPDKTADEDPWVAQQMLGRLAEMGYLEAGDADGVVLDRLRNLGQVYAATGRPRKAIEQYEQVLARKPEDKGCRIGIAWGHLQMGHLDQAEAAVREILSDQEDAPQANFFMGIVCFRRGHIDDALRYLKLAEAASPELRGLQTRIGQVYLRRRRWEDARRAFEAALAADADDAEAHDGMGVVLQALEQPVDATRHHMIAIGLLHHRPQTHLHLGMALAQTQQIDWAIRAFQVAADQDPDNPAPHRCLAQLYRRGKNDLRSAQWHRQSAARIIARRRARCGEAEK